MHVMLEREGNWVVLTLRPETIVPGPLPDIMPYCDTETVLEEHPRRTDLEKTCMALAPRLRRSLALTCRASAPRLSILTAARSQTGRR